MTERSFWEQRYRVQHQTLHNCEDAVDELRAERDRWIRLFNRLDAAVARHRKDAFFTSDTDDALHAAHDRVLKAAATPSATEGSQRG